MKLLSHVFREVHELENNFKRDSDELLFLFNFIEERKRLNKNILSFSFIIS